MSEEDIGITTRKQLSRRDFLKLSVLGLGAIAVKTPPSNERRSLVDDTPEKLIHKTPIESLEELNKLTEEILHHQRAHFKIATPEALQPLIDKNLIKWEDVKFKDPSDRMMDLMENVAHDNGQLRILMNSIAERRNYTEPVAILMMPILTWRVDAPAFVISDVGKWPPHFEEGLMNIDGSILLQPGLAMDDAVDPQKGIIRHPRSWAVITATTNWLKQSESTTGFDEKLIKPGILRVGPWGRNISNYYEPAYIQVGTLTPKTESHPGPK